MRCLAVSLLLSLSYCWSQVPTADTAQTTGPCSPATTGSNNNFTIKCGIGKEQGQKMLAILNRILAQQLDPDSVMAKLDEIGKDVKKLSRGVYSTYDFDGAKRDQRPGVMNLTVGEETSVYQKMVNLQQQQKWKELLETSEDQTKKTPDWLTPYLFSGVANANLGNRSAAIDRLKFVQEQAAGNPDYAEAERLLRQIPPQ